MPLDQGKKLYGPEDRLIPRHKIPALIAQKGDEDGAPTTMHRNDIYNRRLSYATGLQEIK
jgi:hypothetical protein